MENLQVARCFSVLDGRSRSYVLEACRPLQLTYSEYVLLLRLFDCEGASQEDLSRTLQTDKSAVARTLKLLEQKGFICREKDAEDRRIKRIRLTEYGRLPHPSPRLLQRPTERTSHRAKQDRGQKTYAYVGLKRKTYTAPSAPPASSSTSFLPKTCHSFPQFNNRIVHYILA